MADSLPRLLEEIRACRLCMEAPIGRPLPHEPRPVLSAATSARIAIYGQAPGTRVHASGRPFTDPSGNRLRTWMGVTSGEFYDETRIAIVPMGFCFPGLDAKGSDLPPRRECAPRWRARVIAALGNVELALLVGSHAQRWHLRHWRLQGRQLGSQRGLGMTEIVRDWQRFASIEVGGPCYIPLPHPSWRNNAWIGRNPWFEAELLPALRSQVRGLLMRPAAATKPRRG